MRIGLALPHYGFSFPGSEPLTWPGLLDATTRAEALGFDSAWISDHFFLDIERYGGPPGLSGTPELFTALAALAASTRLIRLGTLVACAPFRHPAHVAKMATAIDLLSGGRLELGIGGGWYQREFEAFAYRFGTTGDRFAALEEQVQAVRALFGEEPVDLDGRFVRLSGAFNRPLPAQRGGPPIWIGGKGGDRLLRLVVRHGSGWNTVWRWSLRDYAARVEALRRLSAAAGRDPRSIRLSLGLYSLVGEDEADLRERFRAMQRWMPGAALDGTTIEEFATNTLTGTVEDCAGQLARWAEVGVEEFIVSAAPLPFAVCDWSMVELIANRLIPEAHSL